MTFVLTVSTHTRDWLARGVNKKKQEFEANMNIRYVLTACLIWVRPGAGNRSAPRKAPGGAGEGAVGFVMGQAGSGVL